MLDKITTKYVPRKYQLGWNEEKRKITVGLHNKATALLEKLNDGNPSVTGPMSYFGFDTFSSDPEFSFFGFNSCLFRKKSESNEDVTLFEAQLPSAYQKDGECTHCAGKEEDFALRGRPCLYCNGTKFEWKQDFTMLYALSASLNFLFMAGSLTEDAISWPRPQLIEVALTTEKGGPYGGSLGGHLSHELVNWLSKLHKGRFEEEIAPKVAGAMISARSIMLPHRTGAYGMDISLRDGWRLGLDCEQRCGIFPDTSQKRDVEKGAGFKFICHNTDTMDQQISLLVGLAQVCSIYEEELNKN